MSDQEAHYYLDSQETRDQLRVELSALPPALYEGYKGIEDKVNAALSKRLDPLITDQGRALLHSNQTLFLQPADAKYIRSHWTNSEGREIDLYPGISLLGRQHYINYYMRTSRSNSPKAFEGCLVWRGRIPIVCIDVDYISSDGTEGPYPASPEWLISNAEYAERINSLQFGKYDLYTLYYVSKQIANTVMHEKIHGLQDPHLPSPVIEAAAYYLVDEIFRANDWGAQLTGTNMDLLSKQFGGLLRQEGDDLLRFIFGTYDSYPYPVINAIQTAFSPKIIDQLSKKGFFKSRWIEWRVETP